jgi:hypothetical protein
MAPMVSWVGTLEQSKTSKTAWALAFRSDKSIILTLC